MFAINSLILGNGYGSFVVTLFNLRWSTHILLIPSFFATNTMGAAQGLFDDLIIPWSSKEAISSLNISLE